MWLTTTWLTTVLSTTLWLAISLQTHTLTITVIASFLGHPGALQKRPAAGNVSSSLLLLSHLQGQTRIGRRAATVASLLSAYVSASAAAAPPRSADIWLTTTWLTTALLNTLWLTTCLHDWP